MKRQHKLKWLSSEINCASFPNNSSRNVSCLPSSTSDARHRASVATQSCSTTSTNSPSNTHIFNPPHSHNSPINSKTNKSANSHTFNLHIPRLRSPTIRATRALSANPPLKTSQTSSRSTSGSSTNTWPSIRPKSRRLSTALRQDSNRMQMLQKMSRSGCCRD